MITAECRSGAEWARGREALMTRFVTRIFQLEWGPSSAQVFRYVTASALLVKIAELF
jgi:hypothetical protein